MQSEANGMGPIRGNLPGKGRVAAVAGREGGRGRKETRRGPWERGVGGEESGEKGVSQKGETLRGVREGKAKCWAGRS